MNDTDHNVYQAIVRSTRFGVIHAAAFPGTSHASADFALLPPIISGIGHVDFQPGIPASSATAAKAALFDELWEDLKAISNTARTIARTEPGFSTGFRLGDDNQREILATATSFLGQLQDPAIVAKFVAFDIPADFVTDLQADLTAITGKAADQTDDAMEATGETARVRALIQQGREILKRLDTSVRNRFRNDSQILAEWRTASRIPRRGEKVPEPPTPAPVAPVV
jgi:hypothetical protein